MQPTTPRPLRLLAAFLGAAIVAPGVAGCGSPEGAGSGRDGSGRVSVVASTDVWGDVARSVGGHDVRVTSVVSDPSQDPHSFEATPRTLLAVSRAAVVVRNGGGYDDFMGRMLASSGSRARVVDAVQVSGRTAPSGGELNEHVWYDLPSVQKVAGVMARRLAQVDPAHAAAYASRAGRFTDRVQRLVAEEAALRRQVGGRSIAITEPVPLYLTEACGLRNVTPPEFARAVEEGEDVSAAVLEQTLDLERSGTVSALVYNEQTTGAVTQRVLASAEATGVPVVPVAETLPAGRNYVSWMRDNLTRLRKALDR